MFTHLLPADLVNYLEQISRTTRPGGRAAISCYLLDDARRADIAAGRSAFTFSHAGDGYFAEYAELPEAAIAYEADWMRALFDRCGFTIDEVILGGWATSPRQSQDMIVATRR